MKEAVSIVCSWISLGLPIVTSIKDTIEGINSISESVLFSKLYEIMVNQDSDFDEWLKISEKFDEDPKSYNKMVKQIIFYINAINEADLLYAYSNLLRAY